MNITDLKRQKERQEKITMITCYDYPSAKIVDQTAVNCVLVGDSVAMAVHGHPNTIGATIEMMIMHTEAVARGLTQPLLVSDLPFLAHRHSMSQTIDSVKRLLQAGAEAIKIEGGDADTCATVKYLSQAGVPVFGHIGMTPQSIHQLGGFKVQGKTDAAAYRLVEQAHALEQAGCVAVVLECIPSALGELITNDISIPTIGIGAGSATDGQILVWHDLLGLQDEFHPKFLKQYAHCKPLMIEAINQYVNEVNQATFPTVQHSY